MDMNTQKSTFSKITGFLLAIPKKILGVFTTIGIIPGIFIGLLIAAGVFFGYKWVIGDFSNIVETELTVIESPSILEEVREIGELIGAEYYGEEVHSLAESYEAEDLKTMQNSYVEIKDSYTLIYKRLEKMRDRNGNLLGYEAHLSKAFTDFMQGHDYAQNYDKDWFSAFRRLYGESTQAMLEAFRKTSWEAFYQKYAAKLHRERRYLRKVKNQDRVLVYLGRGIVKAGYDLTALKEEDIQKQGDTLLIKNLAPQILNADINPWFVLPENTDDKKGIPGFEVLKEYASPTHAHHARVKKGCREDLKKSALEQDILATAETRAEETLLNFFNLLARDSTQTLGVVDIQE